jgi:hypothetical protein
LADNDWRIDYSSPCISKKEEQTAANKKSSSSKRSLLKIVK